MHPTLETIRAVLTAAASDERNVPAPCDEPTYRALVKLGLLALRELRWSKDAPEQWTVETDITDAGQELLAILDAQEAAHDA